MTRGQMVIILDTGIYASTEFNGDMYEDGNGEEAARLLNEVDTLDEFKSAVDTFNDNYYNYPERNLCRTVQKENLSVINKKKYFDLWFSDYLYVKNATDRIFDIVDIKKEHICVDSNDIAVFYFGEYIGNMVKVEEDAMVLEKQHDKRVI